MPTPRAHGGAALQPISLVAPGFFGLNTEQEASLLGPEWATTLNNAIFDAGGRVSVRKGWRTETSTPVADDFKTLHEYVKADGTTDIIMVSTTAIYRNQTAPTAITGAVVVGNSGRLKLCNFNDKVIGFNSGIIVYTGTGNFAAAAVNSGTAPNGYVGTCAYGRVWGVDSDGKTIRYSALLDETRWDEADGGGVIDMSQVWPNGQDRVIAIEAFNGDIVVFGENHIVFWTDGAGSNLGILPTDLYVSDAIGGIGAVSQFSVEHVKGDMWFMTHNGVSSLGRVIQEKSNPIGDVSINVKGLIRELQFAETTTEDNITMTFFPKEDMVVVVFPTSGRAVYFNTRQRLPDNTFRAATWTVNLATIAHATYNDTLYGVLSGTQGEVLRYDGFDDDDTSYSLQYESGWLDFGPQVSQYLKMMKRIGSVVLVESDTNVTYSWEFDFGVTEYSIAASAAGGPKSEYNVSEFGANGSRDPSDADLVAGTDVSEYAGGITLRVIPVPTRGTGQFIKVGVSVDTNNANFALQQLTLFAKIGRLA